MKFDFRLAMAAVPLVIAFGIVGLGRPSLAANPTAEQALKLAPIQDGVDYDRPTAEEAAKCKISVKKIDGHVGWVVESPDGTILRKFVDTNGDNVVDQWSYYKDGVEVYREIDSTFDGKVDQYRWFNSGGTRWAVEKKDADRKATGKTISWKVISPEEVTAEVVAALAKQDGERFSRLLLTPEELQSLGLGKAKTDALAAKIARAQADFNALAARQNSVTSESKWVQFGGSKPGVVPADADGPSKDLQVYENVFAVVETGGKHGQVQIGTLLRVGDVWRLIDAPAIAADGRAETSPAGFFFAAAVPNHPNVHGRRARATRRRNSSPTWRSSNSSTPDGPISWSRSPSRSRRRKNGPCGIGKWPTRSAPPSNRASRPRATSGWRRCSINSRRTRPTSRWPPTSGSVN